ncbi:MAG: AMP-binding protein, partial [Parafilimonas sp.]
MNKKSYSHGASAVPLLGETIGENLFNTCTKFPDREALISVHQNYKASYSQLWQQVEEVAKAFLAIDVRKGDRVALWAPNCYEWILV